MAQEPGDAAEGKKKSKLLSIVITGLLLVLAIGAGAATWMIVGPALASDGDAPPPDDGTRPESSFGSVTYSFGEDPMMASLAQVNPEWPRALLIFNVGLECRNQMTADLISAHEARIRAIVQENHNGLSNDQFDDPLLKKNIEEKIRIEINAQLQQYLEQPDPTIGVTKVFHTTWFVQE